MLDASFDRVVRCMVTDEIVRKEISAWVTAAMMKPDMRDWIADSAAMNVLPDEIASRLNLAAIAEHIDYSEMAEHIDCSEIASHVDMQEVTNEVCDNVTPDEIVDCLLQRVG